MASLRSLLDKLGSGVKSLTEKPKPLIQYDYSKYSPRVQRAAQQNQPLIQEARKAQYNARPTNVIRDAPRQLPKFQFADRIQNPVGRLAVTVPQEILNAPRDVFAGSLGLGSNIADAAYGKRVSSSSVLRNVGSIGKGFTNVYAPKGVGSLAKAGYSGGLRSLAKRGAIQGAKIGALGGASYGLTEGNTAQEQLQNALKQAAIGGTLGAGIGAASPYIGRGVRNSRQAIKSLRAGEINPQAGFIGKQSDDLLSQARKYKTPEEFVNNIPDSATTLTNLDGVFEGANPSLVKVWHGTTNKAAKQIEKEGFKIMDKQRFGRYTGDGIYFSPEKFGRYGTDAGGREIPAFVDTSNYKNLYLREGMSDWQPDSQTVREWKSKYDGVIVRMRDTDTITGKVEADWVNEIVVYNPETVKTKSQLTNIWNQANLKGQEGAINFGEIAEGLGRPLKALKKLGSRGESSNQNNLLNKEAETLAGKTARKGGTLADQVPTTTKSLQTVSSSNRSTQLAKGEIIDLSPVIINERNRLIKELKTEAFNPAKDVNVKQKVNLADKLKTPAEVYEKVGLKKAAEALRLSEIKAKQEVNSHITQIQDWVSRAGDRQEVIFDALDGARVDLTPDETKLVGEIRDYLSAWADRLGLPKEKQITNYITHIFEPDLLKKEFDPELAKLIANNVPGSVYDPFLLKRYGIEGYKKDLGLALQAYAKRGVRKANFDPVLDVIKKRTKAMELSQVNYIKNNLERINLRPTDIDNQLDNFIKSTPVGYKLGQRPTMRLSQSMRRMGYRGALGGNVGSAVKNLTQGVNTFAELGTQDTLSGYLHVLKPGTRKELENVGVLASGFIDDKNVSAYKTLLSKLDTVLFYAFEKAEQINRGAAYFGAKNKALRAGKSEAQAILEGLATARKTQFTFGAVDTPEILSSDLAKTFGQFQSFNLKQAEFIKNMVKNKEWAGLLRWIGANAIVVGTVGKLIGYDAQDVVPFSGALTGQTKLGQTPAIGAIGTVGAVGANTAYQLAGKEAPFNNRYGQPLTFGDAGDSLVPIIPGGVQAKKTIQGIGAVNQGASTSDTGRVRFPTPANSLLRNAVFGQYNNKFARFYFDNNLTPLGDKDSEIFKRRVKSGQDPVKVWKQFTIKRIRESQGRKIKELKGMTAKERIREIKRIRYETEKLIQQVKAF